MKAKQTSSIQEKHNKYSVSSETSDLYCTNNNEIRLNCRMVYLLGGLICSSDSEKRPRVVGSIAGKRGLIGGY